MTITTTKAVQARIDALAERAARAEADRVKVDAEIARLALADQPINGQIHKRDELSSKAQALARERQRLIDEELPLAKGREAEAEIP